MKRNFEMIDKSGYCIIFYDKNCIPPKQRSGTRIAYEYAVKKGLKIFNVC